MSDQPAQQSAEFVVRVDRYTVLIDGRPVRADSATEERLRALDAPGRERLLTLLGLSTPPGSPTGDEPR